MILLLPVRGRVSGPNMDNGRCEGLDTDSAFGTQRHMLAVPDDAIGTRTIGKPDQAGQAGNCKSPAFQGQDLVLGQFDTLRTVKHGSSEHDRHSFRTS